MLQKPTAGEVNGGSTTTRRRGAQCFPLRDHCLIRIVQFLASKGQFNAVNMMEYDKAQLKGGFPFMLFNGRNLSP